MKTLDKLKMKQKKLIKIILLCVLSNVIMFLACIFALSMVYTNSNRFTCSDEKIPLVANEKKANKPK